MLERFDTTFSMGVLYHQRSPLDHLRQLRGTLRPGGQLVLETLFVPGDESYACTPPDRYARMRNVWHAADDRRAHESGSRRSGFRASRLSTTRNDDRRATQHRVDDLRVAARSAGSGDPDRTVEVGRHRAGRSLVAQRRSLGRTSFTKFSFDRNKRISMELSPAVEKYVLHWGEMGTRWGTNRTVAQIQALLYLSPEPLRADQIVDALSVARSNVSTSIRELQSYGLVRMTHVLGDRRDYFESSTTSGSCSASSSSSASSASSIRRCRCCGTLRPTVDAETDTHPVTKERIHNMLSSSDDRQWLVRTDQRRPTSTLRSS